MSSATDLITEQLREAEAVEQSSLSLLERHLRDAPPGPYRAVLRRHLDETRRHGHQVAERLQSLGAGRSLLETAITIGEAVVGRVAGLALAPLSLLASRSGPEALLRHAGHDIAAEAREVATYEALERLAQAAGDTTTASLARTIRADEERQLQTLQTLLDPLADRVARQRLGPTPAPSAPAPAPAAPPAPPPAPEPQRAAEGNGGPVHTERETPYHDRAERRKAAKRESRPEPKLTRGAAGRLREAEREREQNAEEIAVETEGAGEPGPEVHVDAPWAGYDDMKASEIVARVRAAPPAVKAMARLYEETNKRRKSILEATSR
jgi:ferritin-like metal-binding protein YciE